MKTIWKKHSEEGGEVMTKTRNKLKITVLLLTMALFIASLGIFSLTANAAANEPAAVNISAEATDVYWYVHSGKLLLSSEQGNSGFYKWSKEDIAEVVNAAGVPWNSSRADITSVIIYDTIAPPSTAFWFQDTNLTSFSANVGDTVYLDMSYTTDASRMFAGCSSLTELNLSGVSAPLVKNIESAFDGCSSIKSLDISCFDGAPIANMMNAFYSCSQLKSLDISCFDGAPIVDMLNAFYGCSKLTELDVSGLDISRVTDFSGVFCGCLSLKALDLSELDGRKIKTLEDTFNGCNSLTLITFGELFTCENVTNMKNTFRQCNLLTSLDISAFSTSKVTDMSSAFAYCEALEELTLGEGFVCSAVTNMKSTFASCKALKAIDTSGWGAVGVKDMSGLFSNCSSLESLDLSGFSGAKPTGIRAMFSGAAKLKSVDLSDLDTSEVTDLSRLFEDCTSLEYFDLSSIDTAAVTNMDSLFKNCTALTSFSFNGMNTSQVESLDSMFSACKNLTSVDLSGLDSSKITDIDGMFNGCSSLRQLDLSDLHIAEGLDPFYLVKGCTNLGMIYAPDIIPESATISLAPYTFYTGDADITELTSENQGDAVVRKFEIKYSWKNGTQTNRYTFEPSYYYYGSSATVTATLSENGYVFGGWTRANSDMLVTEITTTDTGDFYLYAKMTAYQPVAPTLTVSGDAIVTYGEGFDVKVSFVEDEFHTYHIEWYRTTWRPSSGGVQVSGLRNTRGFTAEPKRFVHGITIEEEVYFYCTVEATRKDNGLSKTVISPSIKVYVERAQATITVHPTAIEDLIYDGTPKVVATLGESDFGEVAYSFTEFTDYTKANNKQTNAGVGILYYCVADGIYYKGTEIYTLEYKIEAATPTVAWNSETQTVDYTGEAAVIDLPAVQLLGTDTYNGTISYSYTGTSSGMGLPVNAGTYSVIASIAADGNYKAVSSEPITVVVNKVEAEFDSEPAPIDALIYSGGDQVLAAPGETLDGVVEFSFDGTSWSSDLPMSKNAGEYTVYYRIKGDDNHLDSVVGSLNVSIGKKNITVTADDKVVCVNSDYELTYGVEGLAYGEALSIEVTLNTEAPVGATGDYDVTVSGAATTDNYNVAYVNGTLKVRDHAYNNGEVTGMPSCNAEGEMTYTCSHDSTHTYTEPIPMDENAHAWNEGVLTTEPTCSAVGVKTFTCTHNGDHIKTEDVAVDANAHAWDEGVITKQATCTEKGVKTFTCTHNGEHKKTEAVDALGHKYDNDCDGACNVCAEVRTPAEHSDANDDRICDECGAELPREGLSGGAIAAIAIGAVAVTGLGGFSLFWFVIKKKKWSDIIGIFKK